MRCILLLIVMLNFYSGCLNNTGGKIIKESQQISKVWELQSYNWILSSLSVYQQELFFGGTDNFFYCVDLESGKTKWKFKTQGECYFPPTFAADKIFFTSFDFFLYGLSKEGKEVWRYKLPGRVKSHPIFYSGIIIVSVTNGGILAIDMDTGKLSWELPQGITSLSTTQPILSSDILLLGNLNNTFSAINLQNGLLIWEKSYGSVILSTPSAYDTIVVFGGFNPIDIQKTFINAVNIKTGNEIWKKTLDYNARYSSLFYEGKIYLGTESSEIICLNATDGAEIWKAKLAVDGIGSEIIALNDRLYFGGYERNFYVIDALTGHQINKSSFHYGISNPLFEKATVFFGTGEGILYRVKTL